MNRILINKLVWDSSALHLAHLISAALEWHAFSLVVEPKPEDHRHFDTLLVLATSRARFNNTSNNRSCVERRCLAANPHIHWNQL